MRIIIDLPNPEENPALQTLEEHHVVQIVRDALGEFISARIPLHDYVAKRYADQTQAFRENKLDEVAARIVWVALIKAGTTRLKK